MQKRWKEKRKFIHACRRKENEFKMKYGKTRQLYTLTALQDKSTLYLLHFKTGKLCTHILTRQYDFVLKSLQDKTPSYSLNYKIGQLCTHCISRQENFVLTSLQDNTTLYSYHYKTRHLCTH